MFPTKLISKHRDAAAIDFWRSRHSLDGTLIPPPKLCSSSVYKIFIHDEYYEKAIMHCGEKILNYFSPSSPNISPPLLFASISSNLSSISSPSYMLFHHLSLVNNALPTSRRLRHQNHIAVQDVAPCFFCMKGQDSFSHIYSECVVVSNARVCFFRNLSLDISPFSCTPRPPPSSPSSFSPLSPSECILPRKIHSHRLRNFISSLMNSPSSIPLPSHSPSGISPLAPDTIGASLGPTFLFDIPRALVQPILAFNFAVWKYRKPSRAAAPIRGLEWIVSKIVESATNLISCFKTKKRKSPLSTSPIIDPSISSHNVAILSADSNVAICYTDGSACPNPGLGGAGVSIFLRNSDMVFDAGVSTGYCTNNIAELVALLICFSELVRLFTLKAFASAIIFCDSSYAIKQATGSKIPASNRSLILRLRDAFSKASLSFELKLFWLKGHSTAGGNARVDFLSKTFASHNSPNARGFDVNALQTYSCSMTSWVYGFPLITVPLNLFVSLFTYFPWPSYPCLSAIDYVAPVAAIPSLPGPPKRRKL
jgi:ribonuclease HI